MAKSRRRRTPPAPAAPESAAATTPTPEWRAAHGSPFSAADMRVIGPVLQQMSEQPDGLTPERLLNAARATTHPLHRFFEWNDREAAESWRLEQARKIIRSVVIEFRRPDDESGAVREVRAFHVVTRQPAPARETDPEPEPQRVYVDVARVANDADMANQVIERARRELLAVRDKYNFYRELPGFADAFSEVWAALDRVPARAAGRR